MIDGFDLSESRALSKSHKQIKRRKHENNFFSIFREPTRSKFLRLEKSENPNDDDLDNNFILVVLLFCA